MLRAIVLGAGAGGGFPQWNSAGEGCRRARAGDPAARPRTQAGLAVSADGERWVLVNASPDLRQQIAATPALHPRPRPLRNSPIAAVILTGAEVDAIAGLLHLRERHAFDIYAAAATLAVLAANPIFRALDPQLVPRRPLPLDQAFDLCGIRVQAYPVPGKIPLFAEEDGQDPGLTEGEEALGLALSAGGGVLHYIPGCAMMTEALAARLDGADVLLFDGTLFTDEEMLRLGAGPKTGRRMGHMSMRESMAALAPLRIGRRIFTHINNTNPALLADSPERAELAAAGWEVAEDGMEILL
ncbi:MAG: pyrroloquinoline quinone biosynthesis protein PqqB [Rhodovarius sp.]|nr:pyrroloquinoline quinone biosynthesis protein PqqB [Rhodovarius sp.]MCX7932636.1 pyrroloquinoline quinone biosynthesis protein PqqB [Rhodovarius sp.]MDW8314552.1 pyrroloquinoline quinone biosynthesis protein PqqB [Rhodovarius sp.]